MRCIPWLLVAALSIGTAAAQGVPPSGGGGGGGGAAPVGAATSIPNIVTGGTLTRPANTTAYGFGALMASSVTAGSVVVPTAAVARANDQAGALVGVLLTKSSNVVTNAIFRIHLFNVVPTFLVGDAGAFQGNFSDTGYLGAFDVSVDQSGTPATGASGQGAPKIGSELPFVPVTGTQNIYWVLEVRAGYTPTSGETFTPVFEVR
jgi:hypothetical protein